LIGGYSIGLFLWSWKLSTTFWGGEGCPKSLASTSAVDPINNPLTGSVKPDINPTMGFR